MVGGRNGKIKGFNFYFQDNDKLRPFERRKLLSESEDMISNLIEGSIKKINVPFLDPSNTDMELMDTWNNLYENYGYQFDGLKDRWEKDTIGNYKDFGNKEDESKSFTPLKIDWVEKKKKKLNLNLGF